MQGLMVTKRNGQQEKIDLDKIHRVIDWAAEGLEDVSVSQVELKAHIQFFDGIRTSDIHETIIKSAADLISEETPDYQYMAARLAIFHLRKRAFGRFEPPHLGAHVKEMVALKRYDSDLLKDYTAAEFDQLDGCLDHSRDMNFSYAAVKQMEGKYLVQNRVTGQIHESAQILYMLVGACLFSNYPKATRLDYVQRFYDAVSLFKISLPTPIMSGVRTPTRQFSSCVLIECGDSLDSINATSSAIIKYVSQRAGIGVNDLKPSLPTNNAEISRRDAIKATTAISTASIFLPTTQSLALPLDAPAVSNAPPAVSISAAGKATLPKMGLGAWAWGDSLFWGYSKDEDKELEQVFRYAIENGVSFFDTAELYGIGRSESLIKDFAARMEDADRQKISVATKFAALPWRTKRGDVVNAAEASVRRLGRPIDLYQIHFPNAYANEAYWDGLADCFDKGLVKSVGVR